MKIKTNILEEVINWVVKSWEESEWYNLNMNKAGESKAPKWFTDFVVNSFNPLAKCVATLKQDMVEVKQRLTNIEQDVAMIKSMPTIKREFKLRKGS